MDILTSIIILILLLLPFGETLRLMPIENVAIRPIDIIAGIISLVFIILLITKKKKFRTLIFKPQILIFIVISLISLLVNVEWLKINQFLTSSLYLIRWVSYVIVLWAVEQSSTKSKRIILKLLLFNGTVFIISGFFQYIFFINLADLHYLGWDNHLYRLFSTFLDPDFAGTFLVLFFLFLSGLLYKLYLSRRLKECKLVSILLILNFLALFLTFSRSALIMFIVGIAVFLILINRKKLIIVIFTLLLLSIILISPLFYVESVNLFRTSSSLSRLNDYSIAERIISTHPILGVGFDTYRYAKLKAGFPEDWVNAPSHADAGVTNSFLYVLATTGVIGFLAYIYLWYVILRKAFYLHKRNSNIILPSVVIASAAGLFIDSMFINSLFYPEIMLWMWILIGIMDIY